MSSAGAAPRAAVPVSNARAAASRRTARSRAGRRRPKAGRARRRMRSSTACARRSTSCCRTRTPPSSKALEAALVEELAPVGALQRCSRGASRSPPGASRGRTASRPSCSRSAVGRRRPRARPDPRRQRRALVRDAAALSRRGDGRVLARAAHPQGAPGRTGAREPSGLVGAAPRPAARPPLAQRPRPNEPERAAAPQLTYVPAEPPAPSALHEPAAPWLPNEPESATEQCRAHLNQLPRSTEPATGLSARPTSDPRTFRR